jgi:purine nucleosidase
MDIERARQRLILDCDTGTDDAIAIIAAAGHPRLELVAVTTVSGNIPVARTAENSLRVLDHLGHAIPVYAGADRPFVRPDLPIARDVLNSDNPEFQLAELALPPAVSRPQSQSASEFLIDTFLGDDAQDVCLVATGPLTNLAIALTTEPRLAQRIPRLILMGGAVTGGNVTPAAEFNFWADADAAQTVLSAGIREVTVLPLDATHSVPLSLADCNAFDALRTPAAQAVSNLIRHRIHTDSDGDGTSAPVHDPLCVAYLAEPEVVTRTIHRPAQVETAGALTLGELVVDLRPWTADSPSIHIALAADHDRFVSFLTAALSDVP